MIRASLLLAAASANVQVARAALLPKLTLGADLGSGARTFAQILDSPYYTLTSGLIAPVFNNGRLRAARADYQCGLVAETAHDALSLRPTVRVVTSPEWPIALPSSAASRVSMRASWPTRVPETRSVIAARLSAATG